MPSTLRIFSEIPMYYIKNFNRRLLFSGAGADILNFYTFLGVNMDKNLIKEFFRLQGYPETIAKAHVRILWIAKDCVIEDLVVEEFSESNNQYILYEKYTHDIGNCLSNWEEWTLADVLLKIFVSYQVPYEVRKKVLLELSKVDEWRPLLSRWLYANFC